MKIHQKMIFWLLILVGLFLRLYDLGRASYQIDEINVIQFALQEKGLFTAYQTELDRFLFLHRLPLLMIILHAAIQLMGGAGAAFPTEFVTRLPFALIGVASLPLFYGLGRRLSGPTAGLWAMALACLSPFHLFYSREAYDYSMLLCFSAGVLWAGLELLYAWKQQAPWPTRWALYYVLLAVGLLHAHLSGLILLAAWCAVLGVALMADPRTRGLNRLLPALALLGLPFVFFFPFLVKLLGGGWVDTDSGASVRRMTAGFPVHILGRLGWGEALWALIPFVLSVAWGGRLVLKTGTSRSAGAVVLVHLLLVTLLQAWLLRVARFEIRYFAALQPSLLLLAGVGLAGWPAFAGWAYRGFRTLAYVALVGWLAVNAWTVTQLDCRISNFKGLARWITEHLPENGIYCFWNGYEMRGVPAVYPTPGRHATFPVTWSTEQDYAKFQVRERMISLFQRFPTAAYVEYYPSDVLDPSVPHNPPVPRAELFMRQLWLQDPAFQRLVRWKTHPLGEAQWYSAYSDHVLISYNRVEDLPELARRQQRSIYHYFGKDWSFTKDQQMNDWLVTSTAGTVFIGNVTSNPTPMRLRLIAKAIPQGGRLTIYGPGGRLAENIEIGSQPRELAFDPITVVPGETRLFLEILPPPGAIQVALMLYGLQIEAPGASPN